MKIGHCWLNPSYPSDLLFTAELFWYFSTTAEGENELCTALPLLNIQQRPAATGLQEPQAACPCWEPVAGATDLGVQVDICNTVQGKLVSVGPVLVDVGDGQTGELPHRFVIAGYGREFDGRQGKTVGARQISARQKKAG